MIIALETLSGIAHNKHTQIEIVLHFLHRILGFDLICQCTALRTLAYGALPPLLPLTIVSFFCYKSTIHYMLINTKVERPFP